jgi:hypothetical protein
MKIVEVNDFYLIHHLRCTLFKTMRLGKLYENAVNFNCLATRCVLVVNKR